MGRGAGHQGVIIIERACDAANCPHVHLLAIVTTAQQELRCSIPPECPAKHTVCMGDEKVQAHPYL